MFCLPPHTTHDAQPLDVSFFGALKSLFLGFARQVFAHLIARPLPYHHQHLSRKLQLQIHPRPASGQLIRLPRNVIVCNWVTEVR